jgi:hypothetical protein
MSNNKKENEETNKTRNFGDYGGGSRYGGGGGSSYGGGGAPGAPPGAPDMGGAAAAEKAAAEKAAAEKAAAEEKRIPDEINELFYSNIATIHNPEKKDSSDDEYLNCERCNPCVFKDEKISWDDKVKDALNKAYNDKVEKVKDILEKLLPEDFNHINVKHKKELVKNLRKNNLGEKLIEFYGKLRKSWSYEKSNIGVLSVRVTWNNVGNIKLINCKKMTEVIIDNRKYYYGREYIPSETSLLLGFINRNSKLKILMQTYTEYKQDIMLYRKNLDRGIATNCYIKKWLVK